MAAGVWLVSPVTVGWPVLVQTWLCLVQEDDVNSYGFCWRKFQCGFVDVPYPTAWCGRLDLVRLMGFDEGSSWCGGFGVFVVKKCGGFGRRDVGL